MELSRVHLYEENEQPSSSSSKNTAAVDQAMLRLTAGGMASMSGNCGQELDEERELQNFKTNKRIHGHKGCVSSLSSTWRLR